MNKRHTVSSPTVLIPTDGIRRLYIYHVKIMSGWLGVFLLKLLFVFSLWFIFTVNICFTIIVSLSLGCFFGQNATGSCFVDVSLLETSFPNCFCCGLALLIMFFLYMLQSITSLIGCTSTHYDTTFLTTHYHKVEKRLRYKKWTVALSVPLWNGNYAPVHCRRLISIVWNVLVSNLICMFS